MRGDQPPDLHHHVTGQLPSYGGAGDGSGGQEGRPGQTNTNNNQNSRQGSQTSSASSSGSDSPVGSASSGGARPDGEPSEENNFGFPAKLGRAGIDFPIFSSENIPATSFSCESKVDGG